MGKAGCHLALGTALLLLAGCGAYSHSGDERAEDTIRADDAQIITLENADMLDPAAPATTDGSSPNPAPPSADAAPGDSRDFIAPTLDPLDLGPFAPEDAPELLSLYMDVLLLDLLDPAAATDDFDSAPPYYDVTYLEQLCRDRGYPDHACQSLYGY